MVLKKKNTNQIYKDKAMSKNINPFNKLSGEVAYKPKKIKSETNTFEEALLLIDDIKSMCNEL
ncbi:hypothetical protein RB653_006138 [Dictyostelium firmibasis]|uniref:Uncharacterized protein n=1 Tax=Dictyostelium firmibasis TaxID=79012 RepID=A0AAN7YZX9_9MYCE